MREVSCRALEPVERAAAVHGLRYEDLASGLAVTVEQLRDPAGWVEWNAVAELMERFERATSPEACIQCGRDAVNQEIVGPLRRVAGRAISLRLLYRAGLQWQLPLLYRNIRVTVRWATAQQMEVEVVIPAHDRGSCAWLRLLQGGLEALPSMSGLPPAGMTALITDHHAIYRISLPKQPWRPLSSLQALFGNVGVAELERQVEELRVMARERDRVDDALRERERMFSNLIANLSGMVYRCRPGDWRFEFVSERCLELTGYDPHQIVAQGMSSLALVHPEDVERVRKNREASFAAHQPSSTEYRLRTCSGELRWVLDVARGVYDADGQATGLEGFVTDVTDRKRLEESLNHALRVEGVGRLAGGIAHDFNNLLCVILGAAELAEHVLPIDSPAREYNHQIIAAAERAAALTRQLLAFARKQVVEPRVVDLNALVHGMTPLLRRTLPANVELTSLLSSDLWNVEVDPGQLEQVLLNLVINGRDAMPEGGTLTLETANIVLEEPTAELPGLAPGPHVMLAVRDTGVGMNDEAQQRAFEPFFTTKEVGKGTGLGLASSHGIVRQAHGQIFLSSKPGQGASFSIYLPRSLAEATRATPRAPLAPAGHRETVLVVEDHDMLRAVVVRTLRAQGYTVLEAASAAEALELAAHTEGAVDLLVTDVIMPHLSGLILAERLAAARPNVPVLYMSGYSEQNVLQHHRTTARATLLPKPFAPSALANKVREVLDGARATSEINLTH